MKDENVVLLILSVGIVVGYLGLYAVGVIYG